MPYEELKKVAQRIQQRIRLPSLELQASKALSKKELRKLRSQAFPKGLYSNLARRSSFDVPLIPGEIRFASFEERRTAYIVKDPTRRRVLRTYFKGKTPALHSCVYFHPAPWYMEEDFSRGLFTWYPSALGRIVFYPDMAEELRNAMLDVRKALARPSVQLGQIAQLKKGRVTRLYRDSSGKVKTVRVIREACGIRVALVKIRSKWAAKVPFVQISSTDVARKEGKGHPTYTTFTWTYPFFEHDEVTEALSRALPHLVYFEQKMAWYDPTYKFYRPKQHNRFF